MKNKTKFGKSILLASIAVATFGTIAAGTTYALFTSKAENNVTVSTGKVSISTSVDSVKLYSLSGTTGEVEEIKSKTTFTNGGSFAYDTETGAITLEKFTPGDKVEFSIKATNESNVNIKVRNVIKTSFDNGLFDGLIVKIDDEVFDGVTKFSDYVDVLKDAELTKSEYKISIELPVESGDEYQEKKCELSFKLEAVQGNAKVEAADATVYEIYTATDLAGLAKKANAGTYNYEKVVLMNDIDMEGIKYASPAFGRYAKFDFNGNGKTIKNLTPVVTSDGSNLNAAFVGHAAIDTKIYDVTFDGAKVEGTTVIEDPVINGGVVIGYTDNGKTSIQIDNVSVLNSTVSKVKYSAGIIGYTSTLDNVKLSTIKVDNSTFEGYTAGGIIGQVGGGSVVIDGVTGSNVSVDGYKREGGMVGAMTGTLLTITYDTTKYSSTISGEAIADKGEIVGLKGNTTVNGETL